MAWIEVINVRTVGQKEFKEAVKLCSRMQEDLKQNRQVCVRFYRNLSYETDMSVQLVWDAPEKVPEKTDTGFRLAQLLTPFGLIDHKIWERVNMTRAGSRQSGERKID